MAASGFVFPGVGPTLRGTTGVPPQAIAFTVDQAMAAKSRGDALKPSNKAAPAEEEICLSCGA